MRYERQEREIRTQKKIHKTAALNAKTMFLLLPRLCAWVERLCVDHGLKVHWQLLAETEFVTVVSLIPWGWRREEP